MNDEIGRVIERVTEDLAALHGALITSEYRRKAAELRACEAEGKVLVLTRIIEERDKVNVEKDLDDSYR